MHGDAWHENVLLEPDRVWLLDWEDLSVGIPVVDDAILLMDARGPKAADWRTGRRYGVARRALMLDAAVDGAADWVQNSDPATRAWKDKAYLEGLEAYRPLCVTKLTERRRKLPIEGEIEAAMTN